MARRRIDPEGRRELIGLATVQVLAEHGMRGFTHRAVDAAAGLSAGSVNYYYPTREALLRAAMDALFTVDMAAAAEAAAASGLLEDDLDTDRAARSIAAFIQTMSENDARARLLARTELLCQAQREPEIAAAFAINRQAFVEFAYTVLTRLGHADPADAADALTAVIDGLIHRQGLHGGRLTTGQLTGTIRTALLDRNADRDLG